MSQCLVCAVVYTDSEGEGIHDNITDKNSRIDKIRGLWGVTIFLAKC